MGVRANVCLSGRLRSMIARASEGSGLLGLGCFVDSFESEARALDEPGLDCIPDPLLVVYEYRISPDLATLRPETSPLSPLSSPPLAVAVTLISNSIRARYRMPTWGT